MSVRYLALSVAAVLVVGMGVYLFLEVRSSPAAPQPRSAAVEGSEPPREVAEDDKDREAKIRRGDRVVDGPSQGAGLRGIARKLQNERAGGAPASRGGAPSLAGADAPAEGKLEGPKLDAVMAEANKAYDKMDFDEARSIAQKVLAQHPTNTRMLRIMTSAHCIENDNAEAQKYFSQLPAPDREQMKTRCARYGVTFVDPPK